MARYDRTSRDWNDRAERCRRLADLLRTDAAGARLATLAVEIEQQAHRSRELDAVAERVARHRRLLAAEIENVIGRCYSELFLAKHLLRNRCSYTAQALYEEAAVCREEAASCEVGLQRQKLANQAMQLAMIGEAVARSHGDA